MKLENQGKGRCVQEEEVLGAKKKERKEKKRKEEINVSIKPQCKINPHEPTKAMD